MAPTTSIIAKLLHVKGMHIEKVEVDVLASMIGNTSAGGSCQGRGWRFSGKREMGQPINTGSRKILPGLDSVVK